MYGILGLLAARATLMARPRGRVLLIVILAISLLGALDEMHQHFIPGRSVDIHDWMADTLGAAVGVMLATLRWWRQERAA